MMEQVINLTKANGAGSLAHEWFHGLDNAIGRRNGNPLAMATTFRPGASGNLTLEDRGAVEAIATLSRAMRSQPVTKRSVQADKYRSGVYYSMSEEIGARAFEVWLINRLEKLGIQNDYLANVKDEDVFEAEAALLNLPDSRYPYVKREEFEALDAIYDACFAADGAIAEYLGGMEEIHADLEEGAPAGEIAMSEPGLPEEAKQASFFDDWDDETEISFG